jgi:hypothetical protein
MRLTTFYHTTIRGREMRLRTPELVHGPDKSRSDKIKSARPNSEPFRLVRLVQVSASFTFSTRSTHCPFPARPPVL